MAISRSGSIRGRENTNGARSGDHHVHFSPQLYRPDLQNFQNSSTGHLRTLSKLAVEESEDFKLKAPTQEVVGLHGRRKLQRGDSVRTNKTGTGWAGRTWMDQQRQFLQAYEYLCHIGEAKEWIEDIIQKPIPPIVELEEALRDGITLAEVVQALNPDRYHRIFRNPKLQFRHSDNIAIFFRYLQEVELPDLFWFELVDLYDKKNIPKVIYCIHALSWLLFRKGIVDFRIGNLVGQLQFEDHELEAMQKGLDRAGISLPNFSGMGASFGAEPEETEEERIDRELGEHEATVADFQSQIRGAMLRLRLGNTMQDLWDAENWLVVLQSIIRGDFARQIFQYRLDMRKFAVNLQSAARGYLTRHRLHENEYYWQEREPMVLLLQSLLRGRRARAETNRIKVQVQKQEHGIKQFQAAIRGAMKRRELGDDIAYAQDAEETVREPQVMIRGILERNRVSEMRKNIANKEQQVVTLQAAVRGMLQRRAIDTERSHLEREDSMIVKLQAAARGAVARREHDEIREALRSMTIQWRELQSGARGMAVRKHIQEVSQLLLSSLLFLQARIRGLNIRKRQLTRLQAVRCASPNVKELQSAARGFIQRHRTFELLCKLNDHEESLVTLQSIVRGLLCRSVIGRDLMALEDVEDSIVDLQAVARAMMIRRSFAEKMKFYKENMQKVIKIQSFVRAKQQGEAYKMLTSGKNPPVGTVKNFVHLLNDSDFDFEEEIGKSWSFRSTCKWLIATEFERLRKTVVQNVRQNELAEQYIDQLDIKIALLVKNKITLDEVVKHQKHFGGHFGSLLSNKEISSKDPFDLKALNKNSRKKLEHYQELFFILQTQPQYLARLFRRVKGQGLAESDSKKIELLMMGIFGFAQKRREEYYLLKLISAAIKEEINSCASLQDYLRSNVFWTKLLSSYVRSPRDRKYLRDLLLPIVKEDIMQNESLDLESDPMQIYKSAIMNEELRTGQQSRRRADIPREEAIRDPETRDTFIRHLQDLREIADHFFLSFEETIHKMPYGVRYVAQQIFQLLCAKFPHEAQQHLLTIVGHWLWKTYVQPALLQPDTWGVIDRGLSPLQKRNLGEVAKVVAQVAAGRLFGGENVYLQPINPYISEALVRMEEIWSNRKFKFHECRLPLLTSTVINIRPAEEQFDIDEFNDLYSRTKPTLYMKLTDIFSIHKMIAQDISFLCPSQDDVLREVIRELGSAKNNENDMLHVSSTEITLTLNPKLHNAEDPDAAVKSLFMETKRCILYVIRIQTGANLLDIMVRPITTEDEDKWAALVRDELAQERRNPKKRANPYADGSSLLDITTLSYTELKRTALENILTLERTGRISRANAYQDLLNEIAYDIRSKHRRRVQRSREMDNVRATLAALQQKAGWLDAQLKSYNDYIEQAMVTLQQKAKGKRRFLMPFSKQYNHERELARSGRVPKFGSFKYSARNLAEKGVLDSWRGYNERQWDKINLTISSDEVGIFYFEGSVGSMMIPGAAASVPLDDLLQAQFNNCQYINLFGDSGGASAAGSMAGDGGKEGPLRLNVNLLVHLLMRKFYRDE